MALHAVLDGISGFQPQLPRFEVHGPQDDLRALQHELDARALRVDEVCGGVHRRPEAGEGIGIGADHRRQIRHQCARRTLDRSDVGAEAAQRPAHRE